MTFTFTASRFILVCASFALPYDVSMGQVESPLKSGTIHATGQYELKLKPQKLRMTIAVQTEGANAKSALESFVAHKERVKKELVAMKADEASIEFGTTLVSGSVAGMPAEAQPYEAQYIAQIARAAPNVNTADIPTIVHAVARVRAEWPLPTSDPDALALLPESLREQVKARDLMGEKNKAKLEGRQQEKLDEFQAAVQANGGASLSSEVTPVFTALFVAKVDDDTRKKAVKAAYDRAVAQAELLATATGHKIGELVTLRSSDIPPSGPDETG